MPGWSSVLDRGPIIIHHHPSPCAVSVVLCVAHCQSPTLSITRTNVLTYKARAKTTCLMCAFLEVNSMYGALGGGGPRGREGGRGTSENYGRMAAVLCWHCQAPFHRHLGPARLLDSMQLCAHVMGPAAAAAARFHVILLTARLAGCPPRPPRPSRPSRPRPRPRPRPCPAA